MNDWLDRDKIWAWHEFICGTPTDLIVEFIGGRREDFNDWIRAVCNGAEECVYAGSWSHWKWTPRLDRLLLRMKRERLTFLTACRLLGHDQTSVRQRLAFLAGHTTVDQNDHLALPSDEWQRYYKPQQSHGTITKRRAI